MLFGVKLSAIEHKKLFLVDGVGALLSAILLWVLAQFENMLGLPSKVLYVLSVIPCFFAIYSIFCFVKKIENWRLFMKIIAVANILYSCLTISLMAVFYQKITVLGLLYFVFEIIIILFLASIEWKKTLND